MHMESSPPMHASIGLRKHDGETSLVYGTSVAYKRVSIDIPIQAVQSSHIPVPYTFSKELNSPTEQLINGLNQNDVEPDQANSSFTADQLSISKSTTNDSEHASLKTSMQALDANSFSDISSQMQDNSPKNTSSGIGASFDAIDPFVKTSVSHLPDSEAVNDPLFQPDMTRQSFQKNKAQDTNRLSRAYKRVSIDIPILASRPEPAPILCSSSRNSIHQTLAISNSSEHIKMMKHNIQKEEDTHATGSCDSISRPYARISMVPIVASLKNAHQLGTAPILPIKMAPILISGMGNERQIKIGGSMENISRTASNIDLTAKLNHLHTVGIISAKAAPILPTQREKTLKAPQLEHPNATESSVKQPTAPMVEAVIFKPTIPSKIVLPVSIKLAGSVVKSKMFVYKRWTKRASSFDKITSRINKLCYGLDMNYVDPAEVAKDNLAAETTAYLTTKHPDYAILAARIAISNLHKETKKQFSSVMQDLLQLQLFGFKTLERSYLLRINRKTAERPQHMLMRVAVGIHGDDVEAVIETYNLMSEKYFTHASPTLFNAGNKRPGAFAIYLEPWHADVFEFLDLRKNTGKEENRARDLFYALWIPDMFMRRVESNGDWSLFCPAEAPGLDDVWGDEFDALYEKYEREGRARKIIKAQKLWYAILDSQSETGTPYMLYKDACNRKSNQQNLGTIKCSNLCTEITTKIATYNLNKIINLNYYPVEQAKRSNMRHRPIGLGVQGLADTFIKMRMPFDSPEAKKLNIQILKPFTLLH
ncbi:hypothetical protein BSLG_005978 [Batrachochytrium salamandrivorans]|nr:hypothetical protein BSLG_005978 [Batrachochytrium salamandrivorans]